MLQNLMSPEEAEMKERIKQKGGQERVLGSKKVLKELLGVEVRTAAKSGLSRGTGKTSDKNEIEDLWEDVHSGPLCDIQENMQTFAGKFDILQQQIDKDNQEMVCLLNQMK